MRALVIGADGFVGRWLCAHLIDSADTVDAIVGPHYARPLPGVAVASQVDVRDTAAIAGAIAQSRPDAIYYLAGVSRRGERDALESAAAVSVVGALGVLTAAASLAHRPRILYVSTGLVYAAADEPRGEGDAIAPHGMYAAAKYAGEVCLQRLGEAGGVQVVIARAFNHIGPGQSDAFVVPTIARQVAGIPIGHSGTVRLAVGRAVRDFCDVRDVVRSYRLLIDSAPVGQYNIGSGEGIEIAELTRLMLQVAGVSAEVLAERDFSLGEPRSLVADTSKVESLGWQRRYSLRDSVRDVLDAYRPQVR